MADWVTISSLATAGGTLVLAVATFSSVRSANRAARTAERSLLAGLRPVIVPSREDDPPERVMFGDDVWLTVAGHACTIEKHNGGLYMVMGIRNAGQGLAVIHGWRVKPAPEFGSADVHERPDPEEFRRQSRDLYIPAGDSGFWQGAIRDPADADRDSVIATLHAGDRVLIDLLYGDWEGGQRTIARFSIAPDADAEDAAKHKVRNASVVRYWSVDGADPR
jgi:hypothetical protein